MELSGWAEQLDWISTLRAQGACAKGFLALQDKKKEKKEGKHYTYGPEAFLMTCREEENSGFHIQETHVRDK